MNNDFNLEHVGSSFQDWLEEEGFAEEVYASALKELQFEQIEKTLKKLNV
jgi:hypothetical protein